MNGEKCLYYRYTGNGGARCTLLSPEDWKKRCHSLMDYCYRGGKGCPILARLLSKSCQEEFLSNHRVKEEKKLFSGTP